MAFLPLFASDVRFWVAAGLLAALGVLVVLDGLPDDDQEDDEHGSWE